jgi:hypothetical protein
MPKSRFSVDEEKRSSFGHGHADAACGDAVATEGRESIVTQVGRNGHQ